MTHEDILEAYPELEEADLSFSSDQSNGITGIWALFYFSLSKIKIVTLNEFIPELSKERHAIPRLAGSRPHLLN